MPLNCKYNAFPLKGIECVQQIQGHFVQTHCTLWHIGQELGNLLHSLAVENIFTVLVERLLFFKNEELRYPGWQSMCCNSNSIIYRAFKVYVTRQRERPHLAILICGCVYESKQKVLCEIC